MRPFQQLRFWLRGAPVAERTAAGVATLVAIALIGWLLVPAGESNTEDLFASGPSGSVGGARSGPSVGGPDRTADAADPGTRDLQPADGGTGPAGAGGPAGAPGPGAAAGAAPAPGSGGEARPADGGQGCVSPPGSLRGITDDEVRVAIVLTQIIGPAANELFDVPTPAEARADFDAVVAGINAEGGVACRRLVADYLIANPTDESQMMRLCREAADGGYFAVVDTGSLATRPAVLDCFGRLQTPYFGAFFISEAQRRQSYPYLFGIYTLEHLFNATAFGLRDLGFFDPANGFEKLGYAYRSCERQAVDSFRGWIREAGVPDAKVTTYSVGCPAVFASESDLAAAVRQFQTQGVTHVVLAGMQGDYQRFTEHAELQGFRPRYGFPDEALLSIAEGNRRPNARNMENALAVTLARDAEQYTPGMAPNTPGTQRCNAYRSAAGLRPVWEAKANAGNACSQLWMLRAAVDNAPELSHAALPLGLQAAGRMDFSFPQGMADFSAQGTTTGGQFWRVAQYQPGCQRECWRVIQDFQRGRL